MTHAQERAPAITGSDDGLTRAYQPPAPDPKRRLVQTAITVNTSQQVGGSLGTALLNTIAATATANYLITHHGAVQAGLVHGYRLAFSVSAAVLAAGFVAAFLVIRAGRDDLPDTRAAN